MGLKDIHLKHCYDSDEDDILNDFYIPALENACKYYRLAGFFNSKSLAIAARGIQGLVKNDGEMKLVTGAILSKEDVEAIREGIEDPEKAIEKMMIKDLDEIEDKFVEDHVRALGWLVANKKLEIKIAIPVDDSNLPLDMESAERSGIFHQKIGILEDEEGNVVSFSGSENETATSWRNNIEEFKVFRSWIEAERQYLEADLKRFYKFWNGTAKRTKVIDIPRAIRERLIRLAPRNFDELKLDRWIKQQKKKVLKLRDYQKDALYEWWSRCKGKGIAEMATGTGKTFVALGAIDMILSKFLNEKILIIIAVPQAHLIEQWHHRLEEYGIINKYDALKLCVARGGGWKNQINKYGFKLSLDMIKALVILATHKTFSSNSFISNIRKIIRDAKNLNILLVADEVHHLGAPTYCQGLLEEYNYRLGLSATPDRLWDDWGTSIINEYFKNRLDPLGLDKAIDLGLLTPYRYYPFFVKLTDDEVMQYCNLTRSIVTKLSKKDVNDDEKYEGLRNILIKRAKIVKNAQGKLKILERIIDEIREKNDGSIKRTIIYCDNMEQLKKVINLLQIKGIKAVRFTSMEGKEPSKKYNNLSEREAILQDFSLGVYDVVVAIKALDEGVDVPEADKAIIMASSKNPLEYIQRIGRVIRKHPSKSIAEIYDIVVVPLLNRNISTDTAKIEKKIFEKELERVRYIWSSSLNKFDVREKIYKIEKLLETEGDNEWGR